MADEINELQISGLFKPATLSAPQKFGNSSKVETVTEKAFALLIDANVTTTSALLDIGAVAVPRRLWVENNGAFPVSFCSTSGGTYDISVPPGSQNYISWAGAAIYRKGVGGTTEIRYFVGGA